MEAALILSLIIILLVAIAALLFFRGHLRTERHGSKYSFNGYHNVNKMAHRGSRIEDVTSLRGSVVADENTGHGASIRHAEAEGDIRASSRSSEDDLDDHGRGSGATAEVRGARAGSIFITNQPYRNDLDYPSESPYENIPVTKQPIIDWEARDTRLLHNYFEQCAKYDDIFKEYLQDDRRSREFFTNCGLALVEKNGRVSLTRDGILFCCRRELIPLETLHVHVKFKQQSEAEDLTEEIYGSLLYLYEELNKRLLPLSRRRFGTPDIRDDAGGENIYFEYPRTALLEALVNFLIHRDFLSDDIGFITIYLDRIEFINPGQSPIPAEALLTSNRPLRPKYSRNPRLIEAMNRARLNQREGGGILRIRRELEKNNSQFPDGTLGIRIENDSDQNRFALTIFRRPSPSELSIRTANTGVNFGHTNTFEVGIGNVAGRDINRTGDARPQRLALHQLRAPVGDFVGREAEIDQLVKILRRSADQGASAVITGVRGMGGIGKTELAYAVAARAKDEFPDAQLLVELRGSSSNPLTPAQALQIIIRTFEPEARLPDDLAQLIGKYRSVLVGKRVLIFADDAKDVAQIQPLLLSAGSALLVTSRNRFSLPGMTALDLGSLASEEAQNLLLAICPRIGEYAPELAVLCGYLPLALRVSASLLRADDTRDVKSYIRQLKLSSERLAYLRDPDNPIDPASSVEASLELSYDALGPAAQAALIQLSVFVSSFDEAAARAVVKLPGDEDIESILGLLRRRSLLDWEAVVQRYNLHELVRAFAMIRTTDLAKVQLRYAQYYAQVVEQVVDRYFQGRDQTLEGLALFDQERAQIDAGLRWAQERPGDTAADELLLHYVKSISAFGTLRYDQPGEGIVQLEAAIEAARRQNKARDERALLSSLGRAYADLGNAPRAVKLHEQALSIARALDDRRGEEATLTNLGLAYAGLGDLQRAIELHEQALSIARNIGNAYGEEISLTNLGLAYGKSGDMVRAIEYYQEALRIARQLRDRRGEVANLTNLAMAYGTQGNLQRAIELYKQQLNITREIGDRDGEASGGWRLGLLLEQKGDLAPAAELMQVSLEYERQAGRSVDAQKQEHLEQLRRQLSTGPDIRRL